MPAVNCRTCGKSFYAKPSWLKAGWGKYCSLFCRHRAQRTGEVIRCFICGKSVYKQQRDLRRSRSKKLFCGKSCQTVWRNTMVYIGPNHSNWKNGEHTYRRILVRHQVPQECKRCGDRDTRILAVHHMDRNRTNNKLGNLAWLCYNCHFLVHHYSGEKQKFMGAMV